jgi:hypothetical protein
MPRFYKPYICQTVGELNDKLGWMMLNSPTFKDKLGYFLQQNVDTAFPGLNDSLANLRRTLGEERYVVMREMSDRMRAHFEADPEDKTDDALAGRKIIHEIELMLRRMRAAPK